MNEKCKCTFPGAIQVKKRPDIQYWRQIRHNTPTWKKWMNWCML